MPDLATLASQVVIGSVPLGAAWFAYRQSTQANRRNAEEVRRNRERQEEIDRTKVDSEAFERAKALYDSGIALLERQLARVQEQFNQLDDDAAEERDVLMRRIRNLQTQVDALELTVVTLRRQLIDADIAPVSRSGEPGLARPPDM
jgi:predicted RNase H-like nuclease (RuvC/YqgF family)